MDLGERVARLEVHVEGLREDTREIKSDVKTLLLQSVAEPAPRPRVVKIALNPATIAAAVSTLVAACAAYVK